MHVLPNLLILGMLRSPKTNADIIHRGYINYYWRKCRTLSEKLYTLILFLLSPYTIVKKSNRYIKKQAKVIADNGYKTVFRQRVEQYYLSFFYSIDAKNYYLQEFYRADGLKRARQFVNKGAIKRSVYNLLIEYGQQVNRDKEFYSLDKKVEFSRLCQDKGLPVVPVLLDIRANQGNVRKNRDIKDSHSLPRKDIFCKPGQDNEGKGAEVWLWQGENIYKNHEGQSLSGENLKKRLTRLAKKHSSGSILVQPLVFPHKVLGAFRKKATPTVRIITYLDQENGAIKPDSAMFRFSWKEESVVDNASAGGMVAPICIKSGRLGAATGIEGELHINRWEYLPERKMCINGFTMPYWLETINLVTQAHNYFTQYLVIGWDIIITDQGPVILEGNSQPGLCYMQKANLKTLGEMDVGSAMASYVKKAERYLYSGVFQNGFSGDIKSLGFYQGEGYKSWLRSLLINNKQTIHLLIEGKVQGVGYRKWFEKQAHKLKITGWVGNRSDGKVEAVIKGRAADVEDLVRLCRLGPKNAVTDNIEVKKYRGPLAKGFEVK